MPPISWDEIPPEVMQQLLQQMAAQGEYSTSKGWLPMDQGTQAQALDLQQDLLDTLFDPRFAMQAGDGAYDSDAMSLAMQQYDPGSFEGETFLQNVLSRSKDSPQALVAAGLMKGYDPTTAVAEARAAWEANGMDWPKVTDKDGMEVDDPSITQFAQDGWTQLMSDRAPTGTNDPFAAAGFSDPRRRFDPTMFSDVVDPMSGRPLDVPEMQDPYRQRMSNIDFLGGRAEAQRKVMEQAKTREAEWFKSRPEKPTYGGQVPAQGIQRPPLEADSQMKQAFIKNMMPTALGGTSGAGRVLNPNQQATKATLRWSDQQGKAANELMRATAKANNVAQQYGTPFMMQLAQRQAALRKLGVLP